MMREWLPFRRYAFAVTFHRELLQKVGESCQPLRVGQNRVGIGFKVMGLPQLEKCHHHR